MSFHEQDFKDVAMGFTQEEWALCQEVMLENYQNLLALGKWLLQSRVSAVSFLPMLEKCPLAPARVHLEPGFAMLEVPTKQHPGFELWLVPEPGHVREGDLLRR